MKPFALASLFGLLWLDQSLPAQTAKPVAKSPGRYLFIVETSSAMQRRAKAVREAMRAMLSYDLNGQLRRGDTLGIWTCNEQLYAGRFPLEVWTPGVRETIVKHVLEFLKTQRYEKQTRWERMFPELERVMKSSEDLTVLLISSGDKEIQGTPFDRQINLAYAQWRGKLQQTRMPFITVLRARNGQFLNCTVNLAPWPVKFPAFPQEQLTTIAAKPPQKTPAKIAAPVPPPGPRPLLILDMSKSAKPEVTKAAEARIAPAEQSQAPAPAAVVSPAPAPQIERMEAVPPAPTPVAIPKPPESPPVIAVAPTVAQAVTTPEAPPLPSETLKNPGAQAPLATMATPVAPSPPAAKPAEEQAAPPFKSEAKPTAEPAEVRKVTELPSDTGVDLSSQKPAAASPPPTPAQTAMTTPPTAVSARTVLLIGAIVLLTIVAGLGLLLLCRTRAAANASLITRSMDRKEK